MQVTLIAAMSVDGYIARHVDDRSFDWTSIEDKKFYVEQIKRIGTVVMGSKTFDTFHKYPKGLEFIIYSRTPDQFVNPKPHVITAHATDQDPQQLLEELAARGVTEVAICGGSSIYSLFMQAGVVDRLLLTVEPIVFGSGVSLFSARYEAKLTLQAIQNLSDQAFVLDYAVG